MGWKVRFDAPARKQFRRLSSADRVRISNYLHRRIPAQDHPTDIGDALTGTFRGYWKYRVGDYRVIVKIMDEELVVLVIRIGHRREVYR